MKDKKICEQLEVSRSFVNRMQYKLGIKAKKKTPQRRKAEESEFFSFTNEYDLFIGRN